MDVGYHHTPQLIDTKSNGRVNVGDKGIRDLIFHDQQYSLNSHQCQSSSYIGIGQLDNIMGSLETTLQEGLVQSNHVPSNVIVGDME